MLYGIQINWVLLTLIYLIFAVVHLACSSHVLDLHPLVVTLRASGHSSSNMPYRNAPAMLPVLWGSFPHSIMGIKKESDISTLLYFTSHSYLFTNVVYFLVLLVGYSTQIRAKRWLSETTTTTISGWCGLDCCNKTFKPSSCI